MAGGEVSFRVLKLSDDEAVRGICRTVYGGFDIVPIMFKKLGQNSDGSLEWTERRDCHPIALICKAELVGIANVRVIDQGKTAWLEGYRVHPDFRKFGLGMKLHEEALRTAIKSGARRARYTVWEDNKTSMNFALQTGFSVLQDNAMQVMWLPKPFSPQLLKVKSQIPHDTLKSISWGDLISAVRRSNADLVPGKCVIFDWTLYEITRHFTPESEYHDGNFVYVRLNVALVDIDTLQLAHFDEKDRLISLSVAMERDTLKARKVAAAIFAFKREEVMLHTSHWIKKVHEDEKFELLDVKTTLSDEITPEWVSSVVPGSKQMLAVEKKLSPVARL